MLKTIERSSSMSESQSLTELFRKYYLTVKPQRRVIYLRDKSDCRFLAEKTLASAGFELASTAAVARNSTGWAIVTILHFRRISSYHHSVDVNYSKTTIVFTNNCWTDYLTSDAKLERNLVVDFHPGIAALGIKLSSGHPVGH